MPDINVTLAVHTCSCGACYAIPPWAEAPCPFCSQRKMQDFLDIEDQQSETIFHLKNIIAGLRGALKIKAKERRFSK